MIMIRSPDLRAISGMREHTPREWERRGHSGHGGRASARGDHEHFFEISPYRQYQTAHISLSISTIHHVYSTLYSLTVEVNTVRVFSSLPRLPRFQLLLQTRLDICQSDFNYMYVFYNL